MIEIHPCDTDPLMRAASCGNKSHHRRMTFADWRNQFKR